jgi:trigger factor
MKILQKDIKSNKVKYKILSSEKIWTDQQEIVRKSLAKKIKVPGFRVGHVPVDIARKQISEYEVINGALKKAVDKNYDDLVNDKDFDSDQVIEDSVSIELGKVDAQNLEVTFIFDKFPEVTIEDYKKIKINYVQPEIKKSEIEHQINRYLAKDTMLIPKNADVISEGDMVNFDFKGFVDDKPFDGGESKGYELKIGSNSFIPGFEKQMIGLKKGEKKTIDIIFPNDYHTENLRGKKAKFELNINDIKTIKQPVLDEAYISKFAIHNVKNEAQFKKYITNQLMEQKEYFEKQKAIKKISA